MRKIAAGLGGGGNCGFFFLGGGGGMKRVPVRKKKTVHNRQQSDTPFGQAFRIHKIVIVGRILLYCVVPESTHTLRSSYHQRLLYIQKRGEGVGSTNQNLPWGRHAD